MRETLHQLSLALALPIAVAGIWIVRGEPTGNPARETATAYRVELAELPLPTRERLRTPGVATDLRVARVTPEDPTPHRRRPLLPSLSVPPPVDLAVDADSGSDVTAPLSPRAAQAPQRAAPRAPLVPLRAAPALIAVAPLAASPRTASVAAKVATSDSTTLPAVPAPTPTAKSTDQEPAAATLQSLSKPARVAALEPAPALSQRDLMPVRSRGPVSVSDSVRGPTKNSPIVTGRVGIDPSPRETFEDAPGHAPLTPPGQLEDRAYDLSLTPNAQEPSLPIIDLPLPPLETAAAPSVVDPKPALSEPTPIFLWPPTLSPSLRPIPEPGSALLLGAALAALGMGRRSRRRA